MIELAARAWDLTIPQTVAKLQTLGLPLTADRREVEKYVQQHVERRKQVAGFWSTSAARYVNGSTQAQRLIQRFGLHCEVGFERMRAGMSQLVGISDKDAANQAIYPTTARSKGHIFKDGKAREQWGTVLVIPFYDLPNRICSLMFIGRKGRQPQDIIFRPLSLDTWIGKSFTAPKRYEAGLSMHPDIYKSSIRWDKTVVAVPNPLLALHLHARHFSADAYSTLPIVGWMPENACPTNHSWHMFCNRRLVLWAPTMHWQILQQAIVLGAKLSLVGPEEPGWSNLMSFTHRKSPEDLVQHIRKTALPWPEAMAKHCEKLDDHELEGLVLELQLCGTDLQKVVNYCPTRIARRISSIAGSQTVGRSVYVGGKTITERDGGWWAQGGREDHWETVLSAQLRIDYLIYRPRSGGYLAQGRVFKNGHAYEFCVDSKTLLRDPVGVINDTLMPAGLNVGMSSKWGKQLLSIAEAFQAPKTVKAAEIIGWDTEQSAFVLPKQKILLGGELKPTKGMVPKGSPGEYFKTPEPMSGQELAPLCNHAHAPQVWACVVTLLSNIVAKTFHKNPSGIGTVGDSISEAMRVIAADCGCVVYKLKGSVGGASSTEFQRIVDMEKDHEWPLCVHGGLSASHLGRFTDIQDVTSNSRNCIVPLCWYTGTTKKLHGGWHILEHAEPIEITREMRTALRQLIPAYLLDLMTRRLELADEGDCWWETVMADLGTWVQRAGLEPEPIFMSRSCVYPSEDHGSAEAFADLTAQLAQDGRFSTVPEGFETEGKKELIRLEEGQYDEPALLVPRKGLADLVAKHAASILDTEKVREALQRAGKLLANANDGWVVPEEWWLARLRHSQNARTGLLRVRA
jgi:hypothetical protein